MAGAGDGGGRAAAALEIVEGEEDDAPPSLSARALEALTEFLAEQQRLQEETGVPTRGEDAERDCAVELVSEDWRLSQFWYEPGTARTVAEEIMVLCAAAGSSCLVACVACPTIYAHLKKMDPSISVHLLEFDRRFEQYGADFTFYDYNQPYELPSAMHHAYQVVIADPPYLVSTSRRFTLIRCSSPNHRTFPWEDDGRQLFQRASKKQPLAGTRKQSSSQEHEGTHSLARTDSPRHLAFVHSLRHFLPCSCRVRSAWRRSPGRSPFLPGLKTRACSCSQERCRRREPWSS